jgi:SAM-dependent methyltransferase
MIGVVRGPVLDLGCRDGALAAAVGLPAQRTIGADIDPAALAVARERGVLAPCQADLWGSFPFRSRAFELVLAGEILEHVPFPEDFLQEIHRVLWPGGRVVGSVPNAFRLKNRLLFLAGRWFEQDPTHLHQFSPRSLELLLGRQFESARIRLCVGRWVGIWPRMMANDLVWTGAKAE